MTNPIKAGDLVKSYHFKPAPDRGEMYMIGLVTYADEHRIKFNVISDVTEAHGSTETDLDDFNVGDEVQAAAPGKMMFLEWDGRITKI